MATHLINPATGLPMSDGSAYGVDIGGSPFGVDVHVRHHPWSASYPTWDGGSTGSF